MPLKSKQGQPSSSELICFCNKVSRSQIEKAISDGARSLQEISDTSTAGSGACGGSCRKKLSRIIDEKIRHLDPKAQKAAIPQDWDPPLPLVEALSLFNRRYYWEAHEILEGLWKKSSGDEKLFLQGLIQASAVFYHVLNANPRSVLQLSRSAQDKLGAQKTPFYDLSIQELIQHLQDFERQAREILGSTQSGFDYDGLPIIKMGGEMGPPRYSGS